MCVHGEERGDKLYEVICTYIVMVHQPYNSTVDSDKLANNAHTHCTCTVAQMSLPIMGSGQCSPYVGMTQIQDSSSNQCISIYTAILSPGNKCQHLKALKYAAPVYSSTKSVQKGGLPETVKIHPLLFLQPAQHLNVRSNTVKTAIDSEKISQGWFFCTQFRAKLQSTLKHLPTFSKQCATIIVLDAILPSMQPPMQ